MTPALDYALRMIGVIEPPRKPEPRPPAVVAWKPTTPGEQPPF